MATNPETRPVASIERWERYAAASEGLTEYWYPAMPSAKLGRKLVHHRLLGQDLVFMRHDGRAHALLDRCPHRQIPLSVGVVEFPGHITCVYHGWTFDVTTGNLTAALTDGPNSPILGKVCVRRFPVEERLGLIWVWMGEGEPVPVEEDIPDELLRANARVYTLIRQVDGDWRYAAENGYDESHGKMLHRSSLWVYFKRVAAWNDTEIVRSDDKKWLLRFQHSVIAEDDYPGLGRWPRHNFFQRRQKTIAQGSNQHAVSIRLPAILRVVQPGRANWTHYEWYTPTEKGKYQYLVMAAAWNTGWKRFTWWLRYWSYIVWFHHYNFNNQDLDVVPLMPESHPERFFRPDVSITAWRRLVENDARKPGPKRATAAAE